MENICKNCQKSFEFVIPQNFCSENCKIEYESNTGKKQYNCPHCKYIFKMKEEKDVKTCPVCRRYLWKKDGSDVGISHLTCERCGNIWVPRKIHERVKQCPKCKSVNWDRGWDRKYMEKRSELSSVRLVETLSAAQILDKAKEIEDKDLEELTKKVSMDAVCVYVFIGEDTKVLRIGSTTNFANRMNDYKQNQKSLTDLVREVRCSVFANKTEAQIFEKVMIEKYCPPFNSNDNPDIIWKRAEARNSGYEEFIDKVIEKQNTKIENSSEDSNDEEFVPLSKEEALRELENL